MEKKGKKETKNNKKHILIMFFNVATICSLKRLCDNVGSIYSNTCTSTSCLSLSGCRRYLIIPVCKRACANANDMRINIFLFNLSHAHAHAHMHTHTHTHTHTLVHKLKLIWFIADAVRNHPAVRNICATFEHAQPQSGDRPKRKAHCDSDWANI